MNAIASSLSELNNRDGSGPSSTRWASQSNLIPAQRQLWLGQKLSPNVPLYNMAFLFTFLGEIDVDRFRLAFRLLVQRCDALRMVIEEEGGIPQRRVLAQIDDSISVLNFQSLPDVRTWAEKQSQILFDLSTKLFDTALIRCGQNKTVWYLNQHHLITDMVSLKRLYEVMSDLYEWCSDESDAETLAHALELPAYADVVLPGPSDRAIRYWQTQQLEPCPLYHRSPLATNRPLSRRIACSLSPEQTTGLKQLAMSSEATALTPQLSLFNLVAALVLAYLHRVSGRQQVAFSTPAQGRPSAASKETIGLFIELFPLWVEIEPAETFASLLTKVGAASGGLLRYAQAGASEFTHGRDVNVVLNFLHAKVSDFAGLPVSAEWIHSGVSDPHHHLRILAHDFDGRGYLQLHFDFNSDLFEPELQERAPSHFLALVEAVLADRTQQIARVELLTELEKHRIDELGCCSQGGAKETARKTVVQQFEAQVERTPNAIALSYGSRYNDSLTYRQLSDRANQLAHWLIDRGIVAETPVALYFERSTEMLVALWGVLKAGGTYVPLDSSYPKDRISYILEDTQASWVLTHSELRTAVDEQIFDRQIKSSPQVVDLDTLDLTVQSTINPGSTPTFDQRAYCLYTSGSTGQPKGVEVEHHSLSNYVQWAQQQYVRDRTLAFPLFSSLAFDLTVTSIYVPLISGGQVVIYPEDKEPIDLSLRRVFQDNLVDIIKLTPSHLALVQGMPVSSRIKALILGGEDLKSTLVGEILSGEDVNPELEIYNEYGPTEATVGCMVYRCDSTVLLPERSTSVPIGWPAAGANVCLLDEWFNPVPLGDVGEIFIGGPGVARGYLNRPALTAEKFVLREGKRLYRTGDLGRWEADGRLAYLGRCDRQIKLHGIRIEPGEIEAAIMAHPQVDDCVVHVCSSHSSLEKTTRQLIAYYTSSATQPIADEIKGLIARRLPRRVHPTYFIQLDRIPLTPNGKVDIAGLPGPQVMGDALDDSSSSDSARRDRNLSFAAPQTPLEKKLASIWQQVLHVGVLGRYDNFFDLGGDSIAAIQIAARASDAGLLVSPNQIFQCETLVELAAIASELESSDSEDVGTTESGQKYDFSSIDRGQLDRISQLLDSADGGEGV